MTPGYPLARATTGVTQGVQLPSVVEEVSSHDAGILATPQVAATATLAPPTPGHDSIMRRLSVGARSAWNRRSRAGTANKQPENQQEDELDPELVDLLDVVGE